MEGGTTFHFVTDGIESALRKAREAADGADVRIGGAPRSSRSQSPASLFDAGTSLASRPSRTARCCRRSYRPLRPTALPRRRPGRTAARTVVTITSKGTKPCTCDAGYVRAASHAVTP